MASVTFGPFRLDLRSGELHRSGLAVKLQPQPSKLLVLLVEHAGELVTRDEIRREVWGSETFVDFDQSVNFCIRQIRTALHDNADRPCYVETLPRRGYRFIAPVQRVSDGDIPALPSASMDGIARWPRSLGIALGSLALLLAAVAVGSGTFRHPRPTVTSTGNPKAHQEVELGRFFLNKGNHDGTATAIEHFEAAIREDPQYAPAYAGLADAYNHLGSVFVAGKPPDNVRLLAMRAATRAVQLDPTLAEAYSALGYTSLHELDWAQAEGSLRRAIELNPRYAPAHLTFASYLIAQHRFAEAIEEARRAVDLDPVSLAARHVFAWMLYFDRQYDAAIRELRTLLQMDRTYTIAQWRLGQVLLVAGHCEEAIPTLQGAAESTQSAPAVMGLLAMAYGRSRKPAEAQQILEELEQRSATQHVPPGALTLAYLGADQTSRALDALERVYSDRDNYAIYIEVDPLMDPLRNEPRFQELCRRLRLGSRSQAGNMLDQTANTPGGRKPPGMRLD